MPPIKKTQKLSIYLLKEEVKAFNKALKKGVAIQQRCTLKSEYNVEGEIIIGTTRYAQSSWKNLLQQGTDIEIPELDNSSNRAIIFIQIENRIFALTFGYGKHLIKEEIIDRDFGLRTALNLVDADKLISIDKANLEDLTVLTRTQAGRKSRPETFNLDVIRDLLRGITGEPLNLDLTIGGTITGSEGVYITPKIDFSDIPKSLLHLKKAYESDKYKLRFDWIDNLKEERDPSILDFLNENMVEAIKSKDVTKLYLAPPYIIDWDSFEGISYTIKGDIKNEFNIEDFFLYKEQSFYNLDWDKLQSYSIYIKYSTNEERQSLKLWRCLNYQTEIDGILFAFALGKWYKINKEFSDSVIAYVNTIEESDSDFINCGQNMNEEQYNKALADSNADYALLDQKLIKSDIVRSQIELCDVITNSGELIHVKFRGRSSILSHLFAQGRVSAVALRRDRTFKKNIRTKFINLRTIIPLENKDLDPSKFTITFALIEEKDRSFMESLPFFSLLNFRLTAEDLIVMGYNVRVKKIRIV